MTWLTFALRIVASVLGGASDQDDPDDYELAENEDGDDEEGHEVELLEADVADLETAPDVDIEEPTENLDEVGEVDDEEEMVEVLEHSELPPMLLDYPILVPPVGPNYETDQHKKLLVVTESPYRQEGVRHMPAEEWYGGTQESFLKSGRLDENDLAHLDLRANIANGDEYGKWRSGGNPSHRTYQATNAALSEVLAMEGNVLRDEVAYDNFFARPARHGETLDVRPLDEQYGAEKFRSLWLDGEHKPDVVLIASTKVQKAMEDQGLGPDVLREHGIEPILTNHPKARVPGMRNRAEVMKLLRSAWLKTTLTS